jgi:hypothetical protein
MNVQSTTFRTYATPSRWFDAHGVMKQFKVDEKGRNSGWDCSTGFGVGVYVMCALFVFCLVIRHFTFGHVVDLSGVTTFNNDLDIHT